MKIFYFDTIWLQKCTHAISDDDLHLMVPSQVRFNATGSYNRVSKSFSMLGIFSMYT